jgi:hypothetical protein
VGQEVMLHALIYVSIVQLAAKDWELLPGELNVWQDIKNIGDAIESEVLQQIRMDLETFKIETE